jgi:hypothetical protein
MLALSGANKLHKAHKKHKRDHKHKGGNNNDTVVRMKDGFVM